MKEKLIKRYGDHWERSKMFEVTNGKVAWTDMAWPTKNPPLENAKGIYVLYKDDKPIYVGIAIKGENPIAKRLQDHTKDWLAPWWDSVCWYDFGDDSQAAEIVESLMISHGVGFWNGSQPGWKHFGKQCFLEGNNYASVDLWKK
jgi:hypothetical protein